MPLRVCYAVPRLLPGENGVLVGGSANNALMLARQLRTDGLDVQLIAPIPRECIEFLPFLNADQLIVPLPCEAKGLLGRGISSIYTLRRYIANRLKANAYDVIHTHSGTYPYAATLWLSGAETAVRIHSLYCPLGAKGGTYGSCWEKDLFARIVLGVADTVVTVTPNVAESLRRIGVLPEKIAMIPMSVDTQRFRPVRRPETAKYFPCDQNAVRILFVGNASKEKGLTILLRAMDILRRRGRKVYLTAAIENQSRIKGYDTELRQVHGCIDQLGLRTEVNFLGLVRDIASLYAEADIICIPWTTTHGPSDYPMVVLEAMAMAKCVVSTPVGGCPDLLKHGEIGVLADGFSPESLSVALDEVVVNPAKRLALGEASRRASEVFSLGQAARTLVSLYERLLRCKPARN